MNNEVMSIYRSQPRVDESHLESLREENTLLFEQLQVVQEELQAPTLPEYLFDPRRIYNAVFTLLFGLMLVSILKLLESILLDHVN